MKLSLAPEIRLAHRFLARAVIAAAVSTSGLAATITPAFSAAYNFGGGLGDQTAGVTADVNAAIGYWNTVLPTATHTLTLDIRLANLGGNNKAGLTTYLTKDANGRVDYARLDFNSNTQLWWFDPTPGDSNEFTLQSTYLNKNVNTPDTTLSGCQGPATLVAAQGKWDFLSVVIHEIGHALGIGLNDSDPANFTLYSAEVADGDIDIDATFAALYSGAILPVLDIPVTGSHYNGTASGGDFNLTTMADPGWGRGTRALITDLDTLGIASVYDFAQNDVVLTHTVPEPASFALAAFGVIVLLQRRRPLRLETKLMKTSTIALLSVAVLGLVSPAAQAQEPRIGKSLDIKFTAVDGRAVDLAAMKGKVVLLDFWATWCGPCVGELPHVKEAYDKLHSKGFEIVGISFDSDKARLESFVKDKDMPWPQYFDGKQWKNEYGVKFGINGIPAMWLVDKHGKLRDTDARVDLAKKVEKLLHK